MSISSAKRRRGETGNIDCLAYAPYSRSASLQPSTDAFAAAAAETHRTVFLGNVEAARSRDAAYFNDHFILPREWRRKSLKLARAVYVASSKRGTGRWLTGKWEEAELYAFFCLYRPEVSYVEDERGAIVAAVVPHVPGLRCDIWCYEDALGGPISHRKEGDTLVLTHKLGEAAVISRFAPVDDGLEMQVEASGPSAEAVKEVRSLNPCCQFCRSEAFKNQGDYVKDFVARCFIIREDGLTLLKDTRRIPGTRERKDDRANLPAPWIQEYFPIWRKHPGQVPGQRGYSLDRPVFPLIGCVSRDGKNLAAIAWPESRSLGQVWHDCLHPRPAIGESFDERTNRISSRGKIYFAPNDEAALLEAFRRDFPDWKRPDQL